MGKKKKGWKAVFVHSDVFKLALLSHPNSKLNAPAASSY